MNRMPGNTSPALQQGAAVAVALMLILLAGAVVFFQERMLFTDASFILFSIICNQRLMTGHRVGATLTQMVPLLGSKLHLPLKYLMIMYSCSFVAIFIAGAWVLWRLRRFDLIILAGFYLTLFNTESYFWTNNELHQGMIMLLVSFGIIGELFRRNKPVYLLAPAFVLLLGLSIWTHPLLMIVSAYLWVYLLITGYGTKLSRKQMIGYSLLLIALWVAKYFDSTGDSYDHDKFGIVHKFSTNDIGDVLQSSQMKAFLHHSVTLYWPALVLFLVGAVELIRKRKYIVVSYSVIASFLYLFLLCILYRNAGPHLFYIESEYQLMAILLLTPLVTLVLPLWRPKWSVAVLSAVFAVRLMYLLFNAPVFTARVQETARVIGIMKAKGITKLLVPVVQAHTDKLLDVWGSPYESMLWSSLHNEHPCRTYTIVEGHQHWMLNRPQHDEVLTAFESLPVAHLNPAYFTIDTTVAYTVMNYDDLLK